jgi:hypothetical protein
MHQLYLQFCKVVPKVGRRADLVIDGLHQGRLRGYSLFLHMPVVLAS